MALYMTKLVKALFCFVCVFEQPKVTDEDGWRRFCLGETIHQATSSNTDAETDPAIDYSKVV